MSFEFTQSIYKKQQQRFSQKLNCSELLIDMQTSNSSAVASFRTPSIGEATIDKVTNNTVSKMIRDFAVYFSDPFTFTFMHLADAFIQSDLQCIQAMHFLSVCVFPGNRIHNLYTANAML